jgi:Fur family ferric uptake transcriptional regulator
VPRQTVLDVVREASEFLSAEQVYMEVYQRLPGIGIATVYRTLQLLSELGVVSRVTNDEGKALYRFAESAMTHNRVVVVCRRCGRTSVIPTDDSETWDAMRAFHDQVEATAEFESDQRLHQFYGTCGTCRDQGTGTNDEA